MHNSVGKFHSDPSHLAASHPAHPGTGICPDAALKPGGVDRRIRNMQDRAQPTPLHPKGYLRTRAGPLRSARRTSTFLPLKVYLPRALTVYLIFPQSPPPSSFPRALRVLGVASDIADVRTDIPLLRTLQCLAALDGAHGCHTGVMLLLFLRVLLSFPSQKRRSPLRSLPPLPAQQHPGAL
ncbi:hypothetical protein C8R47DRAFT_1322535 [Mycena vitilis]|nr:hypothetical protein C8R47DRAFT_1322535 [Mycena vitilis]